MAYTPEHLLNIPKPEDLRVYVEGTEFGGPNRAQRRNRAPVPSQVKHARDRWQQLATLRAAKDKVRALRATRRAQRAVRAIEGA